MSTWGIGERVGGRYELLERLGAGGMGVVYLARDHKLEREVALKALSAAQVGDSRGRSRLMREARAAAGLAHPGIVQVHDVAETGDGGAYIVMERVRGRSLREMLGDGPLEPAAAIDIVQQIADALRVAHGAGVVHRDVKPDNVMVTGDGRVVVLDFGLVKDLAKDAESTSQSPTLEQLTRSGAVVGTPAYLAPEQARGRGVVPASDQFALGVVAYELLSGRLPWEAETPTQMLAMILMDDPRPITELSESLPPELNGVFARALAKKPEERFGSVGELASALASALEGAPVLGVGDRDADRATPLVTTRLRDARTRWAMIGGGVLAAAITAVVVLPSAPGAHGGADTRPVPTTIGDDAVVACPLHKVVEAPIEPNGWLGAASAEALCRAIALARGGRMDRIRLPAHLMGVPATPQEGWTIPYDDPGARAASVDAASDADVVLDGALVAPRAGVFSLAVHWGDRRLQVEGTSLHELAREAVGKMIEGGWIEPRPPTRGMTAISGATSYEELAAWAGHATSLRNFSNAEPACRSIAEGSPTHGFLVALSRSICPIFGIEIEPGTEASRDPVARLVYRALSGSRDRAEAQELVEQLVTERQEWERSEPELAGFLATLEVPLRLRLGETTEAQILARRALRLAPHSCEIRAGAAASVIGTRSRSAFAALGAAWCPSEGEIWRFLTYDHQHDRHGVENNARAYFLAPESPFGAACYALSLLDASDHDGLRDLAASYPADGRPHLAQAAAAFMRALVDLEERRFGAAYERAREAVATDPFPLGVAHGANRHLGYLLLQLAAMRGPAAEADAAELIAAHYFSRESGPGLAYDGARYAAATCLRVRPERRHACLDAVESHLPTLATFPGLNEYLRGARAWARGAHDEGREAWRGLTGAVFHIPVEAFDPGSDPARAAQIEQRYVAAFPPVRGARMLDVIRARQAHARGDHDEARRRAQLVFDAWSPLDETLPVVDEMRRIARAP